MRFTLWSRGLSTLPRHCLAFNRAFLHQPYFSWLIKQLLYCLAHGKHVTWDKSAVLRARERLERGGTLWLLVLCSRRSVGTGMADNMHHYFGTIKSYAKEQDINPPDDPEINQGFQNLVNKRVENTEGSRNSVIVGDKPDYVKLTTLGQDLLKTIGNNDEIRSAVKQSIGIELDQPPESWWPQTYDWDNAKIHFETTSKRPPDDADEFEIEAVAEFSCPRCNAEIKHSYTVQFWTETYTQLCTLENQHILEGNRRPKRSTDVSIESDRVTSCV